MITSQITITLEEAKRWYNSDNAILKNLALKAFDIKSLKFPTYGEVKTCIYNNYKDELLRSEFGYVFDNVYNKFTILNKLYNISAFYSNKWTKAIGERGYFISCDILPDGSFQGKISVHESVNYPIPYFEKREYAENALKIIGSDVKYLL